MTEQEAFEAWANSSRTYKAVVENPIVNAFARAAWQARADMAQSQQDKPQLSELQKDAANLLFALHDAWPYVHGHCTINSVRNRILELIRKHGDFADLTKPWVTDVAELVEALQAAVRLAKQAFENWDSDNDSKVGRILGAMAGWSVNYHVDADKLHATLEKYGGAG